MSKKRTPSPQDIAEFGQKFKSLGQQSPPTKPCRFPIDFIEFSFLVEACIPPVPIARAFFWEQVINVYYHTLTANERQRLFEFINRDSRFNLANEDCALFNARFDPANQYQVTTLLLGKEETTACFLWQGKYYTAKSRYISPEYIISTQPGA